MMNEELLAGSALLVQSDALLVSVNIKLALGLQTVTMLVFGLRYAGFYTQLSNVKPTQDSNGSTSKGIGNLNSAFEKADRLQEQKLTGSHFHEIAPLTL
jgi:hypothetical protein